LFLVTPEHTAVARDALGAGALLAVEQGVVLETDPDAARAVAREALGVYATLPNYVNNWKRLGFTDEDAGSLSDRLVDALVAWGDPDTVADRVQAHRPNRAGGRRHCHQVRAGRYRSRRRHLELDERALAGPCRGSHPVDACRAEAYVDKGC
jgi:probable F420-dependent oxidoreductase